MNNNLNVINEGDSFTQYSQISGLNENHFYQEINYQPSFNDIVSNKQLLIEDIEGDLFFNQKLFIDATGMKNGLRGKKDGFTFFGSITHYHGKIINDYVLNLKEDILNNLKAKIYFAIFFDRTTSKFFFKNVKKISYDDITKIDFSCVFFTKAINQYELFHQNMIQIGNCVHYFFIELLNDYSIKVDIISKGISNNVECSFFYGIEDSPVTIGMGGKIPIEKKKTITVLSYRKETNKWYLIDKAEEIWIACDRKIEIGERRVFKKERDIFEISSI